MILILRVKPIRMFSWRLAFLAYCEIIVACKLVGGEGWVGGRRRVVVVVVAGGGGSISIINLLTPNYGVLFSSAFFK